ncbi:Outer membrane protein YfgL [Rhodovulum sp. P5]|uniref:PQQ-like beta-propeller repeat protein n=1 Tax=Rhodovulum sp. P5 TaxID=1564506 RepID=UPI0009C270D8|nr:PQQ-binding-like beta-propeller repeat protein [Rhodovulum sp. P5]ARE38506.1 Outer membrane protein YfgL [Rhodovulum sp. P5]
MTTGFGTLVALDPETGKELWTQRTDAPVTSAPTYRDGIVYIVSRDNRAWAVKASNGRVLWQLPGTPAPSGMIGGASPAVSDRLAIFPFASAELVATLRQSGVRVWAATVAGQRRGFVYANMNDITADPVIAGKVVYTANQAGRAVAVSTTDGERIWTAEEGAYGSVLPVAGSVFLMSDEDKLIRLDARNGETIWSMDLPYFTKKKVHRRKAIYAHYGPILAGGRLWVASSDGFLRAFSPESGALLAEVDLPGGAASRPVVAGGTLYVVSARGELHAFR